MMSWFFGKKKISQAQVEKDDFVSLSSHELRSPLSIIKWYTEILLDGDAGPLTDDQRKYLEVIESSNQRAIDLVRSLLNVSRLDLGTFSVLPEGISLDVLIEEVLESFKDSITQKHLSLTKDFDTSLAKVQLDKKLCSLILKNILSNAITFSKTDGSLSLTLRHVHPYAKVEGAPIIEESLLFSVMDNGIGIPKSDMPKIFTKMFRASNVKDSEATGSGLGLYIIRSILDHVGGAVWFISEEGKGSTFYVTFPIRGMTHKDGKTTLD